MSKVLSILLVFLFSFQSTGWAITLHLCGSNIADVSLFGEGSCGPEDDACAMEDMELGIRSASCCSNKTVDLKSDFPGVLKRTLEAPVLPPFIPTRTVFQDVFKIAERTPDSVYRGPPDKKSQPLFILFQQLLLDK